LRKKEQKTENKSLVFFGIGQKIILYFEIRRREVYTLALFSKRVFQKNLD
jgi:hypothetical protein